LDAIKQAEVLGRDEELQRISALLGSARRGVGAALVIRGEPGAGKSVLLDAAISQARGFRVISTVAVASESELAFGSLIGLLRPHLDRLDELPAAQRHSLRCALGLDQTTTGPVEQLACYGAVVSLLARCADDRPLLVVADDLQWFDAGSRDALLFAARRMRSDPVAFLIAVRDGETEVLTDTRLPELRLGGLDAAAAALLLNEGARSIAPVVAREIWSQTNGNPLALTEVPRYLHTEQLAGRMPLDEPLPVGRRLEEGFARRVAALPPETQRALAVVATSYSLDAGTIGAALGHLRLSLDVLEAGEDAGLLLISGGMVAWRHPLVRSAIYHRASPADRRRAHRALAATAGDQRLPDHRAWHLAAAITAPDERVAADLERVADEAVRRGALEIAMRALSQAAGLSPLDDDRARRETQAADHAINVGRWDEALSLIDSARQRTSDPLMRAQAERILARVETLRGAPVAAHERLVALAESLQTLDPALSATVMTEAVVAHMATGQREQFMVTAERAFELSRSVGGPVEAIAGLVVGLGMVGWGGRQRAIELLDRYGPVADRPEFWRAAPEIVGLYAYSCMVRGDFTGSGRILDRMVDAARRDGAVRALCFPLAQRSCLMLAVGRWPAARADAQEAVDLSQGMFDGAMRGFTWGRLAQAEGAVGNAAAARRAAQECFALSRSAGAEAIEPNGRVALATLALSEDNASEAIHHIENAGKVCREFGEPGWYQSDDVLIESYARMAQHHQAARALERLEVGATNSIGPWARMAVARCRGILAAETEFDPHFQAALALHDRVPNPFERARTELCFGERLRRARRRTEAREHLTRATDTFATLGASLWLARAEHELSLAGQRQRFERHTSPWAELTAAETRVAEVIVEGATYAEAAAALFLSPRTIEAHLRQMYRKLDVRSRSELTKLLALAQAPDAGTTD
jgi:DNA-binding CsgD family transcriptional regulator